LNFLETVARLAELAQIFAGALAGVQEESRIAGVGVVAGGAVKLIARFERVGAEPQGVTFP
jgi:hypothetical protein